MAKQFTLGKNERLKSRKLIEQLFSEGKDFVISPFKVFYKFIPILIDDSQSDNKRATTSNLQFGVGVSTRNFKRAVDRNRIKRIIRETYRLQKLSLQKKSEAKKIILTIFFIYTAKELPVYKDVYNKMDMILARLDKIISEIM